MVRYIAASCCSDRIQSEPRESCDQQPGIILNWLHHAMSIGWRHLRRGRRDRHLLNPAKLERQHPFADGLPRELAGLSWMQQRLSESAIVSQTNNSDQCKRDDSILVFSCLYGRKLFLFWRRGALSIMCRGKMSADIVILRVTILVWFRGQYA